MEIIRSSTVEVESERTDAGIFTLRAWLLEDKVQECTYPQTNVSLGNNFGNHGETSAFLLD